ncbi:type IV secretory system conjugative DNA transfer family protein [Streptomyces turgidiscabies]|uniref:type IV secretory system conjugative DNA transfer family protein n=1 Tax=Streptomyces turgidiscabies TaxID=85558 RepID=UPI0038F60ED4
MLGVPTIVFETWATESGIVHRLKVPWQDGEFIAGQLRTLIPGITVAEDESRPHHQWTRAVELGMRHQSRQLRITNHADLAASLLASVQAIKTDEVVMMQWVLTPAVPERPPHKDSQSKTDHFTVKAAVSGVQHAKHDEIEDRRGKLEEINLQGVGRIGAVAETEARAVHLIRRVEQALSSTRSHANGFKRQLSRPRALIERLNEAAAPLMFPAQFTVSELAAVVAWPIGQPFVAGLPQGSTRHLAATGDVSRAGRVLGHSNYPGNERPIAVGYQQAVHHMYVGGSTGTGKSTLMANSFAQDVAHGYGGIVIDASNSDSNESLFSRALAYVPPERINDVIVVDVNRSRNKPVGFNVLDQGNPRVVVDQLVDLFSHLYQDTKGVWTKQLMYHALLTLAERPGMTFVDLVPLLTPRTADEVTWADEMVRQVKDPELKQFWQRWENFTQNERDRYSQPLMNRAWQLISRPEARYIVGQSESSFKMVDVLRDNKILLVSLAGLPVETSSLISTLFVNALWDAAQRLTPDNPNFLYLDEFQLMTRLPMGLDDMLARARKHRLGVTLGTQYLEDLPMELKNAVINNARSRVIFQSSAKEARTWRTEFGSRYVDEGDFTHIRKYEAIAQLATDSGIGSPVTLRSLAPLPTTGVVHEAVANSDHKYGRSLADVETQMIERRKGKPTAKAKRPPIGVRKWGE